MIIDTHCHLDDESFEADLAAVLERAKDANILKKSLSLVLVLKIYQKLLE